MQLKKNIKVGKASFLLLITFLNLIANNVIAKSLILSETIAKSCNELEQIIPSDDWKLPTYLEMLFVR